MIVHFRMPEIVLGVFIDASPEVCFDLVRDPRVQGSIVGSSSEEIGIGQLLTFEKRVLGIRQRFTVEVVEFERPRRFVDEMRRGVFKSFRHVHEFVPQGGGTLIKDSLYWISPLGLLGALADRVFIERLLRQLVGARNARLKEIAERN